MKESNLRTLVQRYIERAGAALEKTQSEHILLQREHTEQRELLQQRKERKNWKRVAIKGKVVYKTRETLKVVEKAEAEALTLKSKRKRAKRRTAPKLEQEIEEI